MKLEQTTSASGWFHLLCVNFSYYMLVFSKQVTEELRETHRSPVDWTLHGRRPFRAGPQAPVTGFRTHLNPVGPYLTIYTCQRLFPIGHILRFRWTLILGGR